MSKIAVGLGLGTVAFATGSAYFFYDMAILRKSHIKLPEGKKTTEQIEKEAEREAQIKAEEEWIAETPHETVEVKSFDGLRLVADYIPARSYTTDTVILVHGYRSSGVRDFGDMLPFYHEMGVNILLVDDRGHGRSEGNFVCYGWLDHYDVMKWIDYVRIRLGDDCRIVLHGISMGAATVMMTSGEKLPSTVKGVIADCGYTSAVDQFTHMMKNMFHLPPKPIITATSLMTQLTAHYSFNECDSRKALKKTTVPFLFIHGSKDDFVPTSMVYDNYAACSSAKKKLVIVEGASHAESYRVDTYTYEKAVTEFLDEICK